MLLFPDRGVIVFYLFSVKYRISVDNSCFNFFGEKRKKYGNVCRRWVTSVQVDKSTSFLGEQSRVKYLLCVSERKYLGWWYSNLHLSCLLHKTMHDQCLKYRSLGSHYAVVKVIGKELEFVFNDKIYLVKYTYQWYMNWCSDSLAYQ